MKVVHFVVKRHNLIQDVIIVIKISNKLYQNL
jgi:hypothetical protein